MNDLENYFRNNKDRLIHKWIHYFEVYEQHFKRFRDKEQLKILEIGVNQGGSLQMWQNYFNKDARIYGIDINPECKQFEEESIKIFIGSQSDRNFLANIKKIIPKVDILIDDGGHSMSQQIITFEELFDHVSDNGVYICEDTHTSYWLPWGGGYKRKGTFIEYSKNFIDYLNAFHSTQKRLKVNSFTKSVKSIHFYDSMVVIERLKRGKPTVQKTGNQVFMSSIDKKKVLQPFEKIKFFILLLINKILRNLRLPGFIWK